MNWDPITPEEIKEFGRRIESEYVCADNLEDLYGQLNGNYEGWVLIRAPAWCPCVCGGGSLVALVVRPRTE